MDYSFEVHAIKEAVADLADTVRATWCAPHVVYRPRLFADGDQWCALLGDDLMTGVAGFGDTPAAAMADFDASWLTAMAPRAAPLSQYPKETS